jgi:hypothetical protein
MARSCLSKIGGHPGEGVLKLGEKTSYRTGYSLSGPQRKPLPVMMMMMMMVMMRMMRMMRMRMMRMTMMTIMIL